MTQLFSKALLLKQQQTKGQENFEVRKRKKMFWIFQSIFSAYDKYD